MERGQAPKFVERVDKGRVSYEQDNVHFRDDRLLIEMDHGNTVVDSLQCRKILALGYRMEVATMKQIEQNVSPIADWIKATVDSGGIDRLDDLHIDQISPLYGKKSMWIEGGVDALMQADQLVAMHGIVARVALAFSLESSKCAQGVDFASEAEFRKQLDWSPPSLYLFWPMREPWAISYERTDVKIKRFNSEKAFAGKLSNSYCCYLIEFMAEVENEYNRTVFVVRCPH